MLKQRRVHFNYAEAIAGLPLKGVCICEKRNLKLISAARLSEICQARMQGATKKEIAQLLGISLATLNRAQREDKDLAFALRPVPMQELEARKNKGSIS